MNIYLLGSDSDNYHPLTQINEADLFIYSKFNGKTIGSEWVPFEVQILSEPDDELLPSGDFSMIFSVIPVFSQKAVEALGDLLLTNGELLPLSYSEGEYYAFNITTIVDVLNIPECDVVYFPNSEKVMTIRKYQFLLDHLADLQIFKVVQLPISQSFVTERFVEKVVKAGLTGFKFEKV